MLIHLYGASGSGTTTLGKAICNKYDYTHLDTDDYFWIATDPPFTKVRPVIERIQLLKGDIAKANGAVVSGSLSGWGDVFIPLLDLVVRLVVPTEIRLERLVAREYKRFGKRILEGGDMYEENMAFMQWASEYDEGDEKMRSKAMHDNWAKLFKCKHIVLDGTLPLEKLLEQVDNNLL